MATVPKATNQWYWTVPQLLPFIAAAIEEIATFARKIIAEYRTQIMLDGGRAILAWTEKVKMDLAAEPHWFAPAAQPFEQMSLFHV